MLTPVVNTVFKLKFWAHLPNEDLKLSAVTSRVEVQISPVCMLCSSGESAFLQTHIIHSVVIKTSARYIKYQL